MSQVETTQLCDHCGLPLPAAWFETTVTKQPVPPGPSYCCFGCRLAASISRETSPESETRSTLTKLGLAVFFTMNVMAFTMALWSADLYESTEQGRSTLANAFEGLFRYVVLMFSTPVLFLLGEPIWNNAVESLKRGIFSTDLLLATGVAAAFGYSAVSVIQGSGPIYFEVGCVVLVMVTLGRWIEATGRQKANDALDRLARLLPEEVRRICDGIEECVPLQDVVSGDLIRVLAGERIPVDGAIESGFAFVDEQFLTGESEAIARRPGENVIGGSMNLDGDLLIRVSVAGSEGTLARLIAIVHETRRTKGRYERIADKVSAWFVPVIASIAVATFLIHGMRSTWDQGLLQGLAVILIACPCALGLATPLAIWSALGHAVEAQVLFRNGDALERLGQIKAIRFDKTGTLTTGEPNVIGIYSEIKPEYQLVLTTANTLASGSTHILSQAILHATRKPTDSNHVTIVIETHPGRGVSFTEECRSCYLGSRRLLEEHHLEIGPVLETVATEAERDGRSMTWVAWDGQARGLFVFSEQLRPETIDCIRKCRALGLDVEVLTGDNQARGRKLAEELNVRVIANLLPEGKVDAIRLAQARFGSVIMVGDGVNDAPALAAGDIGIALGCGTDLSRDAASICLLSDNLTRIPWVIELSRKTVSVIRGNLFWAFGYNTVGVLLAALGLLNPAFASILMVGSSAFVIINSMRLRPSRTQESWIGLWEIPGRKRSEVMEAAT